MMAQVMELIYIFLSQMDDKVILFVTEIMVSGKKLHFGLAILISVPQPD